MESYEFNGEKYTVGVVEGMTGSTYGKGELIEKTDEGERYKAEDVYEYVMVIYAPEDFKPVMAIPNKGINRKKYLKEIEAHDKRLQEEASKTDSDGEDDEDEAEKETKVTYLLIEDETPDDYQCIEPLEYKNE